MRIESLFALHEPILTISADCWDVLRTEENQKIGEKTKNQATLYGSSKVPEDADTTLGDTQGSTSWHDIPTLLCLNHVLPDAWCSCRHGGVWALSGCVFPDLGSRAHHGKGMAIKCLLNSRGGLRYSLLAPLCLLPQQHWHGRYFPHMWLQAFPK